MTEAPPRDAGRVVIVGGGLGGYSASEKLRQLGHLGPITIVERGPALYDRPPLSKDLFRADFGLDRLRFATAEKLAELNITVLTGSEARSIDAGIGIEEASVTLTDGSVLLADMILLTTGGRPRPLPVPEADALGIIELRTIDDAVRLREAVGPGTRVTVVGAGLIGAEVSSALKNAGADIDLLAPFEVPLAPAVGQLLAGYLHGMHEQNGIRVHPARAEHIDRFGTEYHLRLTTGETLVADVVVAGIGILPNTDLATDAGLEVNNGVIVDANHRTSAPRVFAAGDCARHRGDDGVLERRAEHWEGAQLGGQTAAEGMLGLPVTEHGAEWFWSDRHGVHLEVVGRLSGPGTVVLREGGAHPAVFLVEDGLLVGAASIDDTMMVRAARRIIDQRIPVAEAELADQQVSLRSLLKTARAR